MVRLKFVIKLERRGGVSWKKSMVGPAGGFVVGMGEGNPPRSYMSGWQSLRARGCALSSLLCEFDGVEFYGGWKARDEVKTRGACSIAAARFEAQCHNNREVSPPEPQFCPQCPSTRSGNLVTAPTYLLSWQVDERVGC